MREEVRKKYLMSFRMEVTWVSFFMQEGGSFVPAFFKFHVLRYEGWLLLT